MGLYNNNAGVLTPIAGRGKAEYGASTVRTGIITVEGDGSSSFITVNVTFDIPMPDANYIVDINPYTASWERTQWRTLNQTASGFRFDATRVDGAAMLTAKYSYTAYKLYTDNEYNDLLDSQKINDANVKETLTPIAYTPNYGTKIGDMCYYYKIGSRVFFSLVVENVASDNQQMFYTLPAGYRPLTNIYTSTFQGSGIYIRTNGDVHASPINGKLYCYLEFDAFR